MASSSDWIAQAGMAQAGMADGQADGAADAPRARGPQPGWIAALALAERPAPGGFRDISPFAPDAFAQSADAPQTAPRPATPEPVPEEDPETTAYLRGFAEGHAVAQREGEHALSAEQERFRSLRLAFRALDGAALDALAQDLNATVLALCEQVVGDYAIDQAALKARCIAAARRLGTAAGELTLHLNPETRARLDPAAFADWSLADDPALAPGALRLSGPQGSVREGPADWMRAFAEALGG